MSIDEQLAERFVCCKCNQQGAYVKRFSATGTGLFKLFDAQHNVFIAASCSSCGYTEIYNPDILESRSHATDVLDLLFGG